MYLFKKFEFDLAYKYLLSPRKSGGVSIMTSISFVGIMLAVFALIVTLSVRTGFRVEFVKTILGASSHITIYNYDYLNDKSGLQDYDKLIKELGNNNNISAIFPVVNEQVMVSSDNSNAGAEIIGINKEDIYKIPLIADPKKFEGNLILDQNNVAIGSGLAKKLKVTLGDTITLMSPNGSITPFGSSPMVEEYIVSYIFEVGRLDIDKIRIFMDIKESEYFFNKEYPDYIYTLIKNPDEVSDVVSELKDLIINSDDLFGSYAFWSWKDASSAYLQALTMEDNAMFIILSILILIASLNIVSGLIMLVKNKKREIGILRTIGVSENSIMRIFFICGASIGILGTFFGALLGIFFSLNLNYVLDMISYFSGVDPWDSNVRVISELPAIVTTKDVLTACLLSLSISFFITIVPAIKAARKDPVECIRNE